MTQLEQDQSGGLFRGELVCVSNPLPTGILDAEITGVELELYSDTGAPCRRGQRGAGAEQRIENQITVLGAIA
jgi:hypothetical protein